MCCRTFLWCKRRVRRNLCYSIRAIWTEIQIRFSGGINPARDLGPRLFGLMMFGSEAFAGQHMFFWIPLVAPLVGGIIAAWTYLFTISAHHPDTSAQEADDFESDYKPVQTQGENEI